MEMFRVKSNKIPGANYGKIKKVAVNIFCGIKSKTKRRPYVRSVYFNKEKIFFDYFWPHLASKNYNERVRRLRYFNCAIELIEKSRNNPMITDSRHTKNEKLYRFCGITNINELFYVQIKENKKTGQKYFMSCFPEK
jgi:hypothetical protein